MGLFGSIGNALASIIRIDEYDKKVIIMCGMSAAFAAVFGTPMAAAIFSIEVRLNRKLVIKAPVDKSNS